MSKYKVKIAVIGDAILDKIVLMLFDNNDIRACLEASPAGEDMVKLFAYGITRSNKPYMVAGYAPIAYWELYDIVNDNDVVNGLLEGTIIDILGGIVTKTYHPRTTRILERLGKAREEYMKYVDN